MIINRASLVNLGISFNAAYQGAITQAPSQMGRIATAVPSTTKSEEYGWLGKVPGVREWLGDRVIQNLGSVGYVIKNRSFELTLSVDRDDIDDDNLGLYNPLFSEMGLATVAHKDQLTFGALAGGFAGLCFDNLPYFSTQHPVLDVNGNPAVYANTDAPVNGNPAWYLMDASRYIKPIIWQDRKPFEFVAKDRLDDDNVFNRKEFIYGVDARHNVGYGFPQFCWGSTQPLTPANYGAARQALMAMKGDYGRPIGIMPNLLVVPPALDSQALQILNAQFLTGGGSNIYWKTAEQLTVPWLA